MQRQGCSASELYENAPFLAYFLGSKPLIALRNRPFFLGLAALTSSSDAIVESCLRQFRGAAGGWGRAAARGRQTAERGSAGDALAERVGAEGDTTLAIFKPLPYIHRQFNPYLFCSLYLNPP